MQNAIYFMGISSTGSSGQMKFARRILYSGTVWAVVVVVVVSFKRFNNVDTVVLNIGWTADELLLLIFFSFFLKKCTKMLCKICLQLLFFSVGFLSFLNNLLLINIVCFYFTHLVAQTTQKYLTIFLPTTNVLVLWLWKQTTARDRRGSQYKCQLLITLKLLVRTYVQTNIQIAQMRMLLYDFPFQNIMD